MVLKLDTARDGKTPTTIQGEALLIKSISSGATLTVKINRESIAELDISESGGLRYIKAPFERLYFTHSAQAGLEAEIWILRKGTVLGFEEIDVNHVKILGVALTTPTVEASVPISIENPAIAYNETLDLFKVRDVLPSTVLAGEKTVAQSATPEALASSTTIVNGVLIQAKPSNTARVSIGNSSVQFVELVRGGDWVVLPFDDLANIYVSVAVNGEGVNYIGG